MFDRLRLLACEGDQELILGSLDFCEFRKRAVYITSRGNRITDSGSVDDYRAPAAITVSHQMGELGREVFGHAKS